MFIFAFHHVENNKPSPQRKPYTITPAGLESFIKTLRLFGIEIVSLREVIEKTDAFKMNNRQAILTFDDGYENNYLHAFPVLEKLQCPATIFALSGCFGGENNWDNGETFYKKDRLMSLEQMQEMAQSPYITFGSHGINHSDFSTLEDNCLDDEIQQSHNILKQTLGNSFIPVLAYPWGRYSDKVLQAMERSPYLFALTCEKPSGSLAYHRFKIPRYYAYYRDGIPVILALKIMRHSFLDKAFPYKRF
jgi:peptidoglycan/xylan/chitin deacetylase (PgdA/CDA1 family)